MTWAFKQTLRPAEKILLLAIADYADDEGACWPSLATLVEKTGLSERSIRTHLRTLEHFDLLTTVERRRSNGSQTSNRYVLHMDMTPPAKSAGAPGKLLPPQEPSSEPDLTKTSRDQSRPRVGQGGTDIVLTPVQKVMAGQAGIRDVGALIDGIHLACDREVDAGNALAIALEILHRPKHRPVAPERYVMAAIRRESFIWQKYIDERGMAQ
jgi:hypothetical protein